MYLTTVKLETEQELSDLAQAAARVFNVDIRKMDNSMLFRAGLRLLSAYVSAVEKNVEPGKVATFKICFASRYGWFKNYDWKQSQKEAIREKMAKMIFDDMMHVMEEEAAKMRSGAQEGITA